MADGYQFDHRSTRRIARAVRRVEKIPTSQDVQDERQRRTKRRIALIITDSRTMEIGDPPEDADGRWEYAWVQATADTDDNAKSAKELTGGMSSTSGGNAYARPAFNQRELIHPDDLENRDCTCESGSKAAGELERLAVPTGMLVFAELLYPAGGGSPQIWFDAPNPACPCCTGGNGNGGGE